MATNNITFNETQFSRLFPFHILLNVALEIVSCGKGFTGDYAGKLFTEFFDIAIPELNDFSLARLHALDGQPVVIKVKNSHEQTIQGSFEWLSEGQQYFFTGDCIPKPIRQPYPGVLQTTLGTYNPAAHLLNSLKIQGAENVIEKTFWEEILNNLPADVAVFDKYHNYLFINPKAIANKETREWLIGKNDFDYFAMKRLDNAPAKERRKLFNEALANKEMAEFLDEHSSPDGEVKYILRKYYPCFDNGEIKFVIGYGIDITERRKMEIKLNEVLKSMQISNDELEQFAYVASHDLQEPLRMINSFLMLIERKYADSLDEKGRQYIHFAVDGSKRMQQIILDLLEFSRVGRTEDRVEVIHLDNLVAEICLLQSRYIDDSKAGIHYGGLPTIKSFKTPLRQIFQNLLNNSLKYRRDDVAPVITIAAEEHLDHWQFSFTDNGIGIDEKYFAKIFIIFQRLHGNGKYKGTGIGLAITKKIIEKLGGKIWLKSQPGQGSTFYFTISKLHTNV